MVLDKLLGSFGVYFVNEDEERRARMGEFFKVFGIAICVILADALICLGMIGILGYWEDDDWWLGPLIINVLWVGVVTAILISERMG